MVTAWVGKKGWTCFNNVDAILNVWCPWCGAGPGKHCTTKWLPDLLVHEERADWFTRWAKETKFVPNNIVGENDKDVVKLRNKAAA